MNEAAEIDPLLYLRPPTMDAPTAITLGRSLLAAAPAVRLESFVVARDALKTALNDLETDWNAQHDVTPAEDPRPVDQSMDNAWSCLVGRVECCSKLPVSRHPIASRAREIMDVIAPDGTAILKAKYRVQWAHLNQRLERVGKLGMTADLRSIAGDPYVDEVERCFADYGRVLGITAATPTTETSVDLRERLRAFTQRMTDYSLQVLGMMRRDEPATVKLVRDALKPIDDVRAAAASRRATTATDEPAATPVAPPQPPTPPTRPSASPAPVG
jgi:hypothetical protein